MELSIGNMLYLGLVAAGFGFFIGVLGFTSWWCNRQNRGAKGDALQLELGSLKVHGDKLSHTLDRAA